MEHAHSFFHKNKSFNYKLNALPNLFMTDEEIALWILQGKAGPWLELDLPFDHTQWQKDFVNVKDMFVPHRDGNTGEGTHDGWEACALHGISWDKTNVWQTYGYKQEPTHTWTTAGAKCPNVKSFFEKLPCEKLARVRFMKLKGGGWISPHNDDSPNIDWNKIFDHPLPINIAVDHPSNCHMILEESGCVPFKNGKAFLVNILKNHSVINCSSQDRIHVIGHLIPGNKKAAYCKMLADSYRKQYVLQR